MCERGGDWPSMGWSEEMREGVGELLLLERHFSGSIDGAGQGAVSTAA